MQTMQISNKNQKEIFLQTSPAGKNGKKHSFKWILLALLKSDCIVLNCIQHGEKNVDSGFYTFI